MAEIVDLYLGERVNTWWEIDPSNPSNNTEISYTWREGSVRDFPVEPHRGTTMVSLTFFVDPSGKKWKHHSTALDTVCSVCHEAYWKYSELPGFTIDNLVWTHVGAILIGNCEHGVKVENKGLCKEGWDPQWP